MTNISITSTATGYDITVTRSQRQRTWRRYYRNVEDTDRCFYRRTYHNVSSASMRRFYRLSNHHSNI